MKKVLALIMALAMLLCGCAALAETAADTQETQTLNSVTGLFTLEIPADYIIFDAELVQMLIGDLGVDYFVENGLDEGTAQMVIDTFAQIDPTTQDFVYAPDFVSNMNAMASAPAGLTRDMLPLVKDALDETLTAQYVSMMGLAEEDCVPMDIITIGENDYNCYAFGVNAFGTFLIQYITFADDGTQICLTFTGIEKEITDAIMDTFEFVVPEV